MTTSTGDKFSYVCSEDGVTNPFEIGDWELVKSVGGKQQRSVKTCLRSPFASASKTDHERGDNNIARTSQIIRGSEFTYRRRTQQIGPKKKLKLLKMYSCKSIN